MTLPILVTGGAGYIGSHVCKSLAAKGYLPVSYDDLSSGNENSVKWGPFEYGNVLDSQRLKEIFIKYNPSAVIHMAGFIAAGESVILPYKYYHNNSFGSLTLLNAMKEMRCGNIIFSSTAAVYGEPEKIPIDENEKTAPVNPYGASKLVVEWMLHDFQKSDSINFAALRYFNAAGADPDSETGCLHEKPNNLVPILMQVQAGIRDKFELYGTDYPSHDGTAVRDYIHVTDLAEAHVLALEYLLKHKKSLTLNLGTGRGYTVKEVVSATEKVTGKQVALENKPRRPGDVEKLVADSGKAYNVLKWKPILSDIESIVKTAWKWQQSGYDKYRKA